MLLQTIICMLFQRYCAIALQRGFTVSRFSSLSRTQPMNRQRQKQRHTPSSQIHASHKQEMPFQNETKKYARKKTPNLSKYFIVTVCNLSVLFLYLSTYQLTTYQLRNQCCKVKCPCVAKLNTQVYLNLLISQT